MLAISGDIELNPGPYRYPCGNCCKPVRSNQRGICCDECDKWFHMQCGGLTHTEYARLSNSPESWVCTAYLTRINREQQERQHDNRLELEQQVEEELEHSRFPCRECHRPVGSNQRGVCCDQCNGWFHVRCANIRGTNCSLSQECISNNTHVMQVCP